MRPAEPEGVEAVSDTHVLWRGRRLAFFGGCDYYRLSRHREVLRALHRTLQRSGLTVAASRLTTGNHPLYGELEERLRRFFRAEAALVVPTGYSADLILAQALAGQFSHCLIDARAHGALVDASQVLGCPVLKFMSRSVADLERALARCGPQAKPVLLTDGLFSADGSTAPLADYDRVMPREGLIVVDDAHGAGVLGATGQGTLEAMGVSRKRIVQTLTLSKAFGSYGGAILGSRALRRRLAAHSRQFAGSTPLPLPLAGAALQSVTHLAAHPELRRKLQRNAILVKEAFLDAGLLPETTPGPIVQLVPPTKERAETGKRLLVRHGIFPLLTNYHEPESPGCFRFVISSQHTQAQLENLVRTVTSRLELFGD